MEKSKKLEERINRYVASCLTDTQYPFWDISGNERVMFILYEDKMAPETVECLIELGESAVLSGQTLYHFVMIDPPDMTKWHTYLVAPSEDEAFEYIKDQINIHDTDVEDVITS